MSIASSSINSKQIIKDSQQRLDDEAMMALNFKTVKGNQGGLLATVNEMKGTFYEANDEFYNIVSQYIFLDLNVIYSAITQEARVLDKNEIFETYINSYYNERFMTCLNNYYKHSPSFFKTLFPDKADNVNNRNIHQSFQKYYYLLCIIQYVNDNYTDEKMTNLPLNFYNNIVNWCKTRNDPNIIYQLNGPSKNQVITFDFAKHYHSLISVQNTTQDINDYNKLVRLQNMDNGLVQLFDFLKNMPNVYTKNPNFANQYVLHINTYDIKDKFVDVDGKLVYDLAHVDFGDTTNDTTRAHIDEIDKLKTKDITLSKLNIKKLEKIFNMYSRLKVESLVVDKRTYITDLTKYNAVYLVFEGVQCSDRTVGSNKNIAYGDLAIPGKFIVNDNGDYEFKTFTEYTTYRPERTRVKKCQLYLTTDNNNIIVPYEISLGVSKDDLYNIPLKIVDYNPDNVDYNRVNKNKQFPDIIFNNDNKFKANNDTIYDEFITDKNINKTYNGCYLIATYDLVNDDIKQTKILYLYDNDTKTINIYESNALTEDVLYNFFMHEQHLTNTGYIYNEHENGFNAIRTQQKLTDYINENTLTSNEITDYVNISNPMIVYQPVYTFRNHEILYKYVRHIDVFKNLIYTNTTSGDIFDVIVNINNKKGDSTINIHMPLLPNEYSIFTPNDIKFVYIITSSNGKYFDVCNISINGQEAYNNILPYNIELMLDPGKDNATTSFNPFVFKNYTKLTFEFTLHKSPYTGLTIDKASVSFNTSSRVYQTEQVNIEDNTDIIQIVNKTLLTYHNDALWIYDSEQYGIHDGGNEVVKTFYNDFELTNNVLYNPLQCEDFYNKAFNQDILNNNITLITIQDDTERDIQDIDIFNIIPNGYTNRIYNTTLTNCYVSKSLTDDKIYIESSNLLFNPSSNTIKVNDIDYTTLYIWRCNHVIRNNIDITYSEQQIDTTTSSFDNAITNGAYILLDNNTLATDTSTYFANVLGIIKDYIKNLTNAIDFGLVYETKQTNSVINNDLILNFTHKIGEQTIKNKNFVIIVRPFIDGATVKAIVKVIKISTMLIESLDSYTYGGKLYLYSIPMFYDNVYNIVHCFGENNKITNILISDVFTDKYTPLITPRIKLILNTSFVSINGINIYLPVYVHLVKMATCHRLKVVNNGYTYMLTESLINNVLPDNYYTHINYTDNNYFDIKLALGSDDYYKRFIYLYKHINLHDKYIIIKTNKNISNYDDVIFDDVDINNFYIERHNENIYMLINNSNTIDIKNMYSTVILNKNDMYLTLSWS